MRIIKATLPHSILYLYNALVYGYKEKHFKKLSQIYILIYILHIYMAKKIFTLPTFLIFNPSKDRSSLFPRGKKYRKRFSILCSVTGVKDNKQK